MDRDALLKLIDRAAREGWTKLDLSNRALLELPPEIERLATLEHLDLSSDWHQPGRVNQLTSLPPEISQLANLQTLRIRHNNLSTLPSGIALLTSLKKLELYGNELLTLPPHIGHLAQLEELDLRVNNLKTLPIEIGKLTELTSLRLRDNQLVELPEEIGQLVQLQHLDLRVNELRVLPREIGKLTQLRELYLYGNKLISLPFEISQLTELQILDLRKNQLTSFPSEISHLSQLRELDLWGNQLTALPSEIGQLTQLRSISFRDTGLITLPPEIGQLCQLQTLDLRKNELSSIPPEIGQLTQLKVLNLQDNQLTSLPDEIRQLVNLTHLDLRSNTLPIPPEILAIVTEPVTIIGYYFDLLTEQRSHLHEAKMVLVGQGGVGKTSLATCLLEGLGAFDANQSKTTGIDIRHWELPLQSIDPSDFQPTHVRVNVWDFGGQEIMHATHQFFLTKRTLYLLILDNRLSEAENRLDYWLSIIRSFGDKSPVLVVGNKVDQQPLDLDKRSVLAVYPTVRAILETSCVTGEGISLLREMIAQEIASLPHVNDLLLNTWLEVKASLEHIDVDYIPYLRYVEMCRARGINEAKSQRLLLGFLHDLGIVLHFPDPRLETTNILNPEWVTQGVYRILNTRLPFDEPGVLTWNMLARILHDEPYQEKRMFIVDMMQKFELCYEIPDRPHTHLIPDLLSKEARDTGAWADALRFEVHYPVLPGSILTRLIVRMHRLIKEQIVWRTGVLLACEGNEALVHADLTVNRIQIQVRGPEYGRRDLLTRIREHLDAIHASLTGLQAEEKVPVPDHPEIPPVDYRWLREMERKGIIEFLPPNLTEMVSVSKLLNGVEPPEARREREGGTVYHIDARGSQIGGIGDQHQVKDGINFNRAPEKS